MNILRKLELSGGAVIVVIGILVGFTYFRLDQQSAERVGREFPVFTTILTFSLLDALPGLLILLGSYLHSVKRKQAGQFLLIVGSLANITIFLLFFLRVPFVLYGRLDLFWLSFLSAALAILTSVISVFVQRQR